jgi:protein tyrosine phosphatase
MFTPIHEKMLKKKFFKIPDPIERLECSTGLNNSSKNRYRDVIANEKSRVKLLDIKNDYINADKIYFSNFSYISTQSPLINTYRDFWKMVWDQNTNVIVMLTKFVNGQSEKYFNSNDKVKFEYKESETTTNSQIFMSVELLSKEKSGDNLYIRTFKLKYKIQSKSQIDDKSQERLISHIQYIGWVDHKIPSSIKDIVTINDIMEKMKDPLVKTKFIPIIHCSAGIGRAGTFIACSIIYEYLKKDEIIPKSNEEFIDHIIVNMRKCRKGMVQTPEQYLYIHKFYNFLISEVV